MWMNYGWLDPLGKGYVGNQIGAAAFESVFGSDLTIFTEVENCWRREYSRGSEVMPGAVEDCQGVYDERRRNSRQEKRSSSRKDSSPSTGPVDRRARSAQVLPGFFGRPDRSTEEGLGCFGRPDRSTGEGLCKQPNSLFVSVDRLGRP